MYNSVHVQYKSHPSPNIFDPWLVESMDVEPADTQVHYIMDLRITQRNVLLHHVTDEETEAW